MLQRRLFMLLLRPSMLSLTLSALIATGLLVIPNLFYFPSNSFLYELLFGRYGLTTILQNSQDSYTAFTSALTALSLPYNVVIFLIAILAGLLVFITLQGLHRVLVGIATPIEEIERAGSDRTSVETEIALRGAVRFGSIVGWLLYIVGSTKIIWPYSVLLFHISISQPFPISLFLATAAILLLTLCLHVHVIFARLSLLSPRVFRSKKAIEGLLY